MTRDETIALMAALNRAGLLRILEGQAAIWHEALSDLDAIEATEAVRTIIRERTSADRMVVPGDIRATARPRRRLLPAAHHTPEGRRATHPGDQLAW